MDLKQSKKESPMLQNNRIERKALDSVVKVLPNSGTEQWWRDIIGAADPATFCAGEAK